MPRTRMTPLAFLLSMLSPFVVFGSEYALISSTLCKSNAIKITFMIRVPGRNVEQDMMSCRVQK